MKICIPTLDSNGQRAQICGHFGSAPCFTIYDSETGAYDTIDNAGREHEHGACHPMDGLANMNVDAVLCHGLGRRALEKLNASGIRVYRSTSDRVADAVREWSEGKCDELSADDACRSHQCR